MQKLIECPKCGEWISEVMSGGKSVWVCHNCGHEIPKSNSPARWGVWARKRDIEAGRFGSETVPAYLGIYTAESAEKAARQAVRDYPGYRRQYRVLQVVMMTHRQDSKRCECMECSACRAGRTKD